jgi:hypothetical protein
MIRSGKKSKDSSPAPSRGSSLRGASASDAKRTILNLQNDDWTDEELAAAELQEEKDQIGDASDASLEPLDLAAVAQLMKSTVRKRSPKGIFSFLSFSKSKKDKPSRSGTDSVLPTLFSPPTKSDSILDANGPLSTSGPIISPSSSSVNISIAKSSSFRKKKGSFLKTSGNGIPAELPDELRVSSPSKSLDSKQKAHRRSNSMVDVKALGRLETDLNAAIAKQHLPGSSASNARTGSLRGTMTKKELKDVEKKEKKAQKEAKKEAKRLSKKSTKKEKELSARRSSSSNHGIHSEVIQHRYTTEMTSLPSQFDPASLKTGLTPLASSQRMGSPSRSRPSSPSIASNQDSSVIKVNIATGEVMAGDASGNGMARSISADHFAVGGVHDSLIRVLSSEHLSQDPSTKEKRQSFMNLQMLASDLGSLDFDFGFGSEDISMSGLPAPSKIHIAGMERSASNQDQTPASSGGASSLYSEPSSIGEAGNESDSDSADSDSSDSDVGSDTERDDISVASSTISTSWAVSLASTTMDEADVELNKKALESGAQVELVKKIGRGASGVVWFGLLDSRPVAVKQIELREVSQKRLLEVRNAIKREVLLMQSLNCTHIVRYFGMFASKAQQQITLIMELVAGLSVTSFILERSKLSERVSAFLIQQVLVGLQFLKDNHIIHRDLKPDNLLLNAKGVIKMIDFGTAAKMDNSSTVRRSTVGTPWYCAPEVIRSEEYSFPADIWSLGCTLIEFLSGKPPYDDLQDVACLFKMAEGHIPPLPPGIGTDCQNFLKACLAPNPQDRLTSEQLIEHPWIVETMKDRESIADEVCKAVDALLALDELASRSK